MANKKVLIFIFANICFLVTNSAYSMDAPLHSPEKLMVEACKKGNVELATHLLDAGLNKHELHLKQGVLHFQLTMLASIQSSYIHLAAYHLQLPIVDLLLERGVNVNSMDSCFGTPLMYAISSIEPNNYANEKKALEVVEFLLSRGANPTATLMHEYSALSHATKALSPSIIRTLLLAGARLKLPSSPAGALGNELHVLINKNTKENSSKEIFNRKLDIIELLRCEDTNMDLSSKQEDTTIFHLSGMNGYFLANLLRPLTLTQVEFLEKILSRRPYIQRFTDGLQSVFCTKSPHRTHAHALQNQAYKRVLTLLCSFKRYNVKPPRDVMHIILSHMPIEYTYGEFKKLSYHYENTMDMRLQFLDECLVSMKELIDADTSGIAAQKIKKIMSTKNYTGQTAFDLARNNIDIDMSNLKTRLQPELLYHRDSYLKILNPKS